MSILSRLFGKGGVGAETAPPEDYNGYLIYPEPEPVGRQFRLAARIEKVISGERRTHHLIRADLLEDRETAVTVSAQKARQVIDEQGDSIFR